MLAPAVLAMMLTPLAAGVPALRSAMGDRRQRVHELVLALLSRQGDLELLEGDGSLPAGPGVDPGQWLERNRRLVQRYQGLVRTAATLDTLIDQELGDQL